MRPCGEVFFTHVEAGETVVWAPHVVRHDGRYWMFDCGGDADPRRFRIQLATSAGLWTWTRSDANPLLQDGTLAPLELRAHP